MATEPKKFVLKAKSRERLRPRLRCGSAAYCTVKTAAGLTILPDVAVMFVVWPLVPMTDASPPESMVATVVLLEVHVTEAVMSDVVPSEL